MRTQMAIMTAVDQATTELTTVETSMMEMVMTTTMSNEYHGLSQTILLITNSRGEGRNF